MYLRTIAIKKAIENNNDFTFITEASTKDADVLTVEIYCHDVPSANPYGIKRKELLDICIKGENKIPNVVIKRDSFPDLPHITQDGDIKFLCLYYENEAEINSRWTAPLFLERIHWWFNKSSQGALHGEGQPMEHPFLDSYFELFWSNDIDINKPVYLFPIDSERKTFVIRNTDSPTYDNYKNLAVIPCILSPLIQKTLALAVPNDIHKITTIKSDFYEVFKKSLLEYIVANGSGVDYTLIKMTIPIKKEECAEIEDFKEVAYIVQLSPVHLGTRLKIVYKKGNQYLPDNVSQVEIPKNIQFFPMKITHYNTRFDYAYQSGIEVSDLKITLVGLGALGSIIFELFNRSGWGKWILIDSDYLKPHNVTRHVLGIKFVGCNKAKAMQLYAENTTGNIEDLKHFDLDIMKIHENKDALKEFLSSDVIMDISTTRAYPRMASFNKEYPRHISMFLAPAGNAGVMLIEDKNRKCPQRILEAQYYRMLINQKQDLNHLSGTFFISGASCRDISLKMSFSSVMLFASQMVEVIPSAIEEKRGQLYIWQKNNNALALIHEWAAEEIKFDLGEYVVFIDEATHEKMKRLREAKLPKETGGVVVGYHDFNHNAIFVVDILDAPNDSECATTSFKRGVDNIKETLEEVERRTRNLVYYIGEWHSHPSSSAKPSNLDVIQLLELSNRLALAGYPAVQIIVSEKELLCSVQYEKFTTP